MAAISPFNFTAIGGNLAGAPALMVRCGIGWSVQGWLTVSSQHTHVSHLMGTLASWWVKREV